MLVQKSGYFARAAPAGDFDKKLIDDCAKVAVASALKKESGVAGQDEVSNSAASLTFASTLLTPVCTLRTTATSSPS